MDGWCYLQKFYYIGKDDKITHMSFILILIACSLAFSAVYCSDRADDKTISGYSTASMKRTTLDGKTVPEWVYGVNRLYEENVSAAPSAPKGYQIVHLSHYGRHGARYTQYDTVYTNTYEILRRAHKDSKLTGMGEQVYERYIQLYPIIENRAGELAGLGRTQHRLIASRMFHNYPELFRSGKRIIAISTNLERTMLSMEACCDQLKRECPDIDISTDASKQEMGYLNPHCPFNPYGTNYDQVWKGTRAPWRAKYKAAYHEYLDWKTFVARMFTDIEYANGLGDMANFMQGLFSIAIGMPCLEYESNIDFIEFFTLEELERLADCGDAYTAYLEKGKSTDCPGRSWSLCVTLLDDFIKKADNDIAEGNPVRLRFGHDGCMIGMFVLMDLPQWNLVAENNLGHRSEWDVSCIPMASNIQLAFYRNKEDHTIFTFRLNEEPMTLPLKEVAPGGFYDWNEFKQTYRPVMDEAIRLLKETIPHEKAEVQNRN